MAIEFHTNKQIIKKYDAVSTFTGENSYIIPTIKTVL